MADFAEFGIRADTSDLSRATRELDRVTAAGSRTEKSVGGLSRAFGLLKGAIGGVALGAAVTGLVRSSNELSTALAEVSTLLDDIPGEMEHVTAATKSLSIAFGSSAESQAKGFYQAISAGAEDAAAATDLMVAANKLAVGGATDVFTAVDALTTVMNSYGDKAGDATEISDALFAAMRQGKTTVGEMGAAIGRVTPLASQLGVSFDELLAATAALTKGGISTNEAITGLRAVLASVIKPSSEARKEAQRLGIEFNAAAIQSKGLSEFLIGLAEATDGSEESMAMLFGGIEAIVPILALAKSEGEQFGAALDALARKAGLTEAGFNKMANSPGMQMDRLFSAMKVAAISLGDALAEILAPAAESAANWLNKLFGAQDLVGKGDAVANKMKEIADLERQLAAMEDRKNIPLGDIFFYDKVKADQLSEDLNNKRVELFKLQEQARSTSRTMESTQLVPGRKPNESPIDDAPIATGISESQQFLDQITQEAEQVGKTREEILLLQAARLGVLDKAQVQIQIMGERNKVLSEESDQVANISQAYRLVEQVIRRSSESTMTEADKMTNAVEEFNRAMMLIPESMRPALEDQAKAISFLRGELTATSDEAKNAFDDMTQFGIQAARNLQDTLAQFLFDPFKDGLDGMLDGFTTMLRQMAANAIAANILGGLFGNSGMFPEFGKALTGGMFGGGRATGGPIDPYKLYEVNERGEPEMLQLGSRQYLMNASQSGRVVPMQSLASPSPSAESLTSKRGQTGEIKVNIIESPGKGGQTDMRETSGGIEIDVMLDSLVARKTGQRSSAMNKSMRQNFGLNEMLVAR